MCVKFPHKFVWERAICLYRYTWSSMKERKIILSQRKMFFLHEVKMRTNTVYYDHHAVWKFFLRSCEKNFKNVGVNFSTSGIPESFMDFCQTIVWKINSKFSFSVIWISKYLFAFSGFERKRVAVEKIDKRFSVKVNILQGK